MRAGLLNKFITFRRYDEVDNEYGEPIKQYVDYANSWASIKPMLGREKFTEQMVSTEQTHKITTRYIRGIESTMQIKYGDRIFEIIGNPIDNMENNVYLQFNVKEIFDHDEVH